MHTLIHRSLYIVQIVNISNDSFYVYFSGSYRIDCDRIDMAVTEDRFESQFFVENQAHRQGHLTALAVADQNDRGTLLRHMDRLSGGDLCTGGLDDQVHTGPAGQFLCFGDHILFLRR